MTDSEELWTEYRKELLYKRLQRHVGDIGELVLLKQSPQPTGKIYPCMEISTS